MVAMLAEVKQADALGHVVLVDDMEGVTAGPPAVGEDPDPEEDDEELQAAASTAIATSAAPTRARVPQNLVTLPPNLFENRR
jgi:hypothetical protein